MSDALAQLEPRSVWNHFSEVLRIPRPSGHEEKMASYVRSVAEQHGFEVKSDEVGNLVVDVPATPGHEDAPVIILQGHLDMVCEKNKDVEHDFMVDPIRARIDGEWVRAEGTTLGADNGIGVAAALASATDPSVEHGPLQLLFTLDEETGLTGAQRLDGSLLRGRTLLNLDSEEDGVLFAGCAGGADTHIFLSPSRRAAGAGAHPFLLEVTGLRGGHSGMNIHENRGNALKILVRVLDAGLDAGIDFQLASLGGGSKHNAIPREAEAEIHLGDGTEAGFRKVLDGLLPDLRAELEGIDDGLDVRLTALKKGAREVLEDAERDRLMQVMLALPHGVLGMSPAIPGLVETSNNLAAVNADDGRIKIVTSSRSSVMPTQEAVLASIRAVGRLVGARVETHDGYPGWKPDMASPVLGILREVYGELWKREPKVTAIHAGLECGLLGEKLPGLDMVSFGPQIEGAHSPEERVHVESVERFWDALKQVLRRLAG